MAKFMVACFCAVSVKRERINSIIINGTLLAKTELLMTLHWFQQSLYTSESVYWAISTPAIDNNMVVTGGVDFMSDVPIRVSRRFRKAL